MRRWHKNSGVSKLFFLLETCFKWGVNCCISGQREALCFYSNMTLTFCLAITTRSPSWIPMEASWVLALSESAGRDWPCNARGSGEMGRGKACLSKVSSSLATAAASAISKGISRGSGTTSAGLCPLSFCQKNEIRWAMTSCGNVIQNWTQHTGNTHSFGCLQLPWTKLFI